MVVDVLDSSKKTAFDYASDYLSSAKKTYGWASTIQGQISAGNMQNVNLFEIYTKLLDWLKTNGADVPGSFYVDLDTKVLQFAAQACTKLGISGADIGLGDATKSTVDILKSLQAEAESVGKVVSLGAELLDITIKVIDTVNYFETLKHFSDKELTQLRLVLTTTTNTRLKTTIKLIMDDIERASDPAALLQVVYNKMDNWVLGKVIDGLLSEACPLYKPAKFVVKVTSLMSTKKMSACKEFITAYELARDIKVGFINQLRNTSSLPTVERIKELKGYAEAYADITETMFGKYDKLMAFNEKSWFGEGSGNQMTYDKFGFLRTFFEAIAYVRTGSSQ